MAQNIKDEQGGHQYRLKTIEVLEWIPAEHRKLQGNMFLIGVKDNEIIIFLILRESLIAGLWTIRRLLITRAGSREFQETSVFVGMGRTWDKT